MKTWHVLLLGITGFMLLCSACSKSGSDDDPSQKTYENLVVNHSMKGWELYSWQEPDGWNYSILRGTNRVKNLEEVKSGSVSDALLIRVKGMGELGQVLDKFPEGETITWLGKGWLARAWQGNYGNLSLPPDDIREEVGKVCIQLGLNLQIAE